LRHRARSLCPIAVLLIAVGAGSARADAEPKFERPPVLDAPQLVALWAIKGPRYQIADKVPTDGFQALFTIVSDFGTFKVLGEDLLAARLAEIAALDKLESATGTEAFARAARAAPPRPAQATSAVLQHPPEMMLGLWRLFEPGASGGRPAAGIATASNRTATEAGQAPPAVAGWEQERRRLAKQLGVDPYTSNEVLAKRLDDAAWVSSSEHLGLDVAMPPPSPFSMGIPITSVIGELIWNTPASDLIALNRRKLRNMGVDDATAHAFSRNRHFTLSRQTALVVDLAGFDGVTGRADVVALANTILSDDEARFLVWALQILTRYQQDVGGITALQVVGRLPMARLRGGGLLVAAGVDYVSWTRRLAFFARRPQFREVKDRSVWITGKLSPRAMQEMTAAGWTIKEDVASVK
jgi:hypothetical protein